MQYQNEKLFCVLHKPQQSSWLMKQDMKEVDHLVHLPEKYLVTKYMSLWYMKVWIHKAIKSRSHYSNSFPDVWDCNFQSSRVWGRLKYLNGTSIFKDSICLFVSVKKI